MENRPTYTMIPNKALEDLMIKGLSRADILVYVALCKHYNHDERKCWPSLSTLGKFSCMASRNVSRSLKMLSLNGMVFIAKSRHANNSFECNSYYLPHLVSFQIETLSASDPKKNRKQIEDLRKFNLSLLESIEAQRDSLNMRVGSLNTSTGNLKKAGGHLKSNKGVVSPSPTNNTTINTTINITKNVNKKDDESNDDLTSGFKQLNRYNKELSKPSLEAIGGMDALIKFKREGLVQQLAADLQDEKSIPYFRTLVSKLTEDIIYKCLSLTKETNELSGIRKSRGAVFTDHIKREAARLGIEL